MNKISNNISYKEATYSKKAVDNGLDNTPSESVLEAMKLVADKVFQPLRLWYGKPIKINSFYRSKEVNRLVKGSKNSQHVKGEAIDISTGSKKENKKLFDYIKDNLIFDQLINEYDYSWVHISYSVKRNRQQILVIK